MTSAYYYLTKADYHNRLDKALRELGNEITIPKLSSAYGVTVFHISLTNAVVIYDGDKSLVSAVREDMTIWEQLLVLWRRIVPQ